jgi:hypothetical protein
MGMLLSRVQTQGSQGHTGAKGFLFGGKTDDAI